jgi:hypothetical protein
MQQNQCQVSAETRQLRQDFSRVSAECSELRQTVSDLMLYTNKLYSKILHPVTDEDTMLQTSNTRSYTLSRSSNTRSYIILRASNTQSYITLRAGIYLNGRKHRVFVYTRSQADDLCTNCSTWGHQERNCTASARCGICSDGHRTDRHPNIRNGKNKFRCPNCSGNHQVHHSSCLARAAAVQKQERRRGNVVPREGGPSQVNSGRAGNDKMMEKKRGAPRSSGPGRQ